MGTTAEERLREQLAELKTRPYRAIAGWTIAATTAAALTALMLILNRLPDLGAQLSYLIGCAALAVAGVEVALWALRRHAGAIANREQLLRDIRAEQDRQSICESVKALSAGQQLLVQAHAGQAEAVGRLAALVEATMPHSAKARENMAALVEGQAEVRKAVAAIHETVAVMQQELPPVEALSELQQRAGEHEARLEKVEERVDIAYTTGFTDGISGAAG